MLRTYKVTIICILSLVSSLHAMEPEYDHITQTQQIIEQWKTPVRNEQFKTKVEKYVYPIPAISKNHFATVCTNGIQLYNRYTASNIHIILTCNKGRLLNPVFTPDGTLLYIPHGSHIHMIDPHTQKEIRTVEIPFYIEEDITPLNNTLYVTNKSGHYSKTNTLITVHDNKAGQIVAQKTLDPIYNAIPNICLHPHGDMLAITANKNDFYSFKSLGGSLYLWNIQTQHCQCIAKSNNPYIDNCLTWSPDGTYLAIGLKNKVHFYNMHDTKTHYFKPVKNTYMYFTDPHFINDSLVACKHGESIALFHAPTAQYLAHINLPKLKIIQWTPTHELYSFNNKNSIATIYAFADLAERLKRVSQGKTQSIEDTLVQQYTLLTQKTATLSPELQQTFKDSLERNFGDLLSETLQATLQTHTHSLYTSLLNTLEDDSTKPISKALIQLQQNKETIIKDITTSCYTQGQLPQHAYNTNSVTHMLLENISDENIPSCPICLEHYQDIIPDGNAGKKIITKCNHILCATCFSSLRSPVCPLCRAELS